MPALATKSVLPSDDKRWRIVNGTMRRHGYSRDAVIETLHTVQQSFGFLDKETLKFVAAPTKPFSKQREKTTSRYPRCVISRGFRMWAPAGSAWWK